MKSSFLYVRRGSFIQFNLITVSTDPKIRISSRAHGPLLPLTSLLLEVPQRIKGAIGEQSAKATFLTPTEFYHARVGEMAVSQMASLPVTCMLTQF